MNLLIGLPVFRNAPMVDRCLAAIVSTPATVLVVDNAADVETKKVLNKYRDHLVIVEPGQNMNCNWAWNQALEYVGGFDTIALGSSDVVLPPKWYEVVGERLAFHRKEILLPDVGPHRETLPEPSSESVTVAENIAGAFSFFPREAVELAGSIPAELKFWFGDEYLFTKLREQGWKTVVLDDLKAYHDQSSSLRYEPELYRIIEEDKLAWAKIKGAL